MENFVKEAGPEWDERLLRLLHRRAEDGCFLADVSEYKHNHRYLTERIEPALQMYRRSVDA